MTQRKTRHESTTSRLSRESLHLAKEVRSIQQRAAEHDGRIVSIGALVFFSTDTGDAWVLEPAEQLAVRLALSGDPLPVHIEETETSFAIGWQGRYHFVRRHIRLPRQSVPAPQRNPRLPGQTTPAHHQPS